MDKGILHVYFTLKSFFYRKVVYSNKNSLDLLISLIKRTFMKKILLYSMTILAATIAQAQVDVLTNGSFETGDSSWDISEVNGTNGPPGSCVENWIVLPDSSSICAIVDEIVPTDGSLAAFTSFDSNTPNTQWIIEQEVTLPGVINGANVTFDFTANIDFSFGAPISIPRTLNVEILSEDGSTIISNVFLGEYLDTGLINPEENVNVDVTDDLFGLENTNVILRYTVTVPESETGPGKAMIDNVTFIVDNSLSTSQFDASSNINLSPNPTNGDFLISIDNAFTIEKVSIFDITGKVVQLVNIEEFTSNNSVVNTNLPTGTYFVKINTSNNSSVKKLIIK